MSTYNWDGGAVSAESLSGDGWYSFVVPRSTVGAVVGLNDQGAASSGYSDIDFALSFSRGTVQVIEGGATKTAAQAYAEGTRFYILRYGSRVLYLNGAAPSTVAGIPFELPGTLIYESTRPLTHTVHLDVSLYAPADSVQDAELVRAGTLSAPTASGDTWPQGVASGEFTLSGTATDSEYSTASGSVGLQGVASARTRGTGAGELPTPSGYILAPGTRYASATASLSLTGAGTGGYLAPSVATGAGSLFIAGAASGHGSGNAAGSGSMALEGAAYALGTAHGYGSASGALALDGEGEGHQAAPQNYGVIDIPPPLLLSAGAGASASAGQLHLVIDRDSAVVTDSTAVKTIITMTETAVLSAQLEQQPYATVHESAVLGDYATPRVTRRRDLIERAKANDLSWPSMRYTHDVTDTAAVTDGSTLSAPFQLVRDSALLNDTATPSLRRVSTVHEGAQVSDRTVVVSAGDVAESAVATDAVLLKVRALLDVLESAAIASLHDANLDTTGDLVDVAALLSHLSSTATRRPNVLERGYISAVYKLPATGTAWTANMQNWAMSRYIGTPFNGMTEDFATSADGLYVPTSAPVTASFKTGQLSLGKKAKKRLGWIYTDGTHTKPMKVTVSGDVNGQRQSATYTQMARSATDDRTVKTQVGKGFSSNYYQIEHSSDGDFSVHGVELVTAETARRI